MAAAVGFLKSMPGGRIGRLVLVGLAMAGTAWDLAWAARSVQYASLVATPPITLRDRSAVAGILHNTDRVLSENQNALTLCGCAMLPIYLGNGPVEYSREPTKFPDAFHWNGPLSDGVLDWLRHAGVTHILALDRHADWPLELIWYGEDTMLNALLARRPGTPFWLYRLPDALGRAYWLPAETDARAGRTPDEPVSSEQPIDTVTVTANRVEIALDAPRDALVVVTDLNFPGWQVWVDDERASTQTYGGMFRAVRVPAGRHTIAWTYCPSSAIAGGLVSVGCLAMLGWLARRTTG